MDDILKEIEKSADDIQIPTSLDPDYVKKKLEKGKLCGELNYKKSEYEKVDEGKHKHKKFNVRKIVEYAAAIALIIGISSAGIYNVITRQTGNGSEKNIQSNEINASSQIASYENADKNTRNDANQSQSDSKDAYLEKKSDIGTYHLAKNYEEVYKFAKNGDIQVAYIETDKEKAVAAGNISENKSYASEDQADTSDTKNENYSQTNLQVEGVDESDCVKTDGNYIYVQKEKKVVIADITKKKMNISGEIRPDLGENGYIQTMYVDADKLFLIIQQYQSDKADCVLETYDITDRKNAVLEGSVVVEGCYADSRKVDDIVYLFTRKDLWCANIAEAEIENPEYKENNKKDNNKKDTNEKDKKEKIIPQVNNEKVPAGCIYVKDNVSSEFIAVSVNVKKPAEIVDQMVIMNTNASVYMGTEAIYLYSTDYKKDKEYTDITKFQYKDGYMSGVASKSVKGQITDVFAISESNNILRVLTTEWSEKSKNRLYMLDDNMQVLGKLSGIADGEEIYAARYIGNTAYFITYHNTDPLFAADISDPKSPKIIGEIKITGFSDYLHPYGTDKLLGIGYETDEVTGEQLGVKLTMFDISNPKKLKILDTLYLEGDYCSAAENYKDALVDSEKNVIGFTVNQWNQTQKKADGWEESKKYYLYSWKNNHFVKEFEKKVYDDVDEKYVSDDEKYVSDDIKYVSDDVIRGLYAENTFYLVSPSGKHCELESYDMLKNYETIDRIRF